MNVKKLFIVMMALLFFSGQFVSIGMTALAESPNHSQQNQKHGQSPVMNMTQKGDKHHSPQSSHTTKKTDASPSSKHEKRNQQDKQNHQDQQGTKKQYTDSSQVKTANQDDKQSVKDPNKQSHKPMDKQNHQSDKNQNNELSNKSDNSSSSHHNNKKNDKSDTSTQTNDDKQASSNTINDQSSSTKKDQQNNQSSQSESSQNHKQKQNKNTQQKASEKHKSTNDHDNQSNVSKKKKSEQTNNTKHSKTEQTKQEPSATVAQKTKDHHKKSDTANDKKHKKMTHKKGHNLPKGNGEVPPGTPPPQAKPFVGSQTAQNVLKVGALSGMSLLQTSQQPQWGEPGSLKWEKTAKKVGTKQWEITLTVQGKDITKTTETTDIVLVMDESGSMNECVSGDGRGCTTRLDKTQNAAIDFVNQVMQPQSKIQMALVTFDSHHTKAQDFTYSSSALISAINAINAGGGTNIQAGLHEAEVLLHSSTADHKVIVLLSDGQPTYSYGGATNAVGHTWAYGSEHDFLLSGFNYNNIIGSGSNYYLSTSWLFGDAYSVDGHDVEDNGIATISEAYNIMHNGQNIAMYSIGVDVSNSAHATYVLKNSQNKGYYPSSSDDLADQFENIGSSILAAASHAVVTDPIADPFDLVTGGENGDNFALNHGSQGQANDTVSWDSSTETITWDIGTISEDNGVYQLQYMITVDCAENPVIGKKYPTNGTTTLEYKDYKGHSQTKQFTVPTVTIPAGSCPGTFEGQKVWKDHHNADGNRPDKIMVHLNATVGSHPADQYSKKMKVSADQVKDDHWSFTFTNVVKYNSDYQKISYSLSEEKVAGYETTIEGHTIINTRADTATLTIDKKWQGTDSSDRPDVIKVDLYRSVPGGQKHEVNAANDPYLIKAANNWSLSITQLPVFNENGVVYDYCIQERDVAGYDMSANASDLCTTLNDDQQAITVVNDQLEGSIKIIKVDRADHTIHLQGATFKLKNNQGNVIATGTTNDNGVYLFDQDVTVGTYHLVEVKAPEGYHKHMQSITVEVTEDHLNIIKTIENSQTQWHIPKTGGIGTLIFYSSGMTLMLGTLLLALYIRRKKYHS